jgi:hypothetical protein
MADLTNALVIVLSINLFLFLGQAAINDIGGTTQFYNCQGSLLESTNQYGCTSQYQLDDNYGERLDTGTSGVSATSGNIFTDTFVAIKNWLLESTGVGYLFSILSAPYNFLSALQLPSAFSFAIGSLWYLVTFFLIVNWLFGRGG